MCSFIQNSNSNNHLQFNEIVKEWRIFFKLISQIDNLANMIPNMNTTLFIGKEVRVILPLYWWSLVFSSELNYAEILTIFDIRVNLNDLFNMELLLHPILLMVKDVLWRKRIFIVLSFHTFKWLDSNITNICILI